MVFSINGYWKDDKSEFSGFLVADCDCVPEGYVDDEIFYFGLSEDEIKEAIELKEDGALEFVITSYSEEESR